MWNMVFEAGRMLVSDDVKIEIDGAIVRKVEPAGEAPEVAGAAQS
jgi:hypothetical protein